MQNRRRNPPDFFIEITMEVILKIELFKVLDIEEYVDWRDEHKCLEMTDLYNETSLMMRPCEQNDESSGFAYYAVGNGSNVEIYEVVGITDVHHYGRQ